MRALVRDPTRLGDARGALHSVTVGDLSDVKVLREAVRGCDVVVHIAGLTKARRAHEFMDVNREGTRRLAETALEASPRPRRFILISSMAAAGPSKPGVPLVEDDPCEPISKYGESKFAGETVAREILGQSGVELVILRPPIVYGEGDRDVLTILQQVSRGFMPLVGGKETLTKGYSLVHVDDLASAIALACVKPQAAGKTFFVPGPRDATFEEMLTAIEAAVGRKARRVPVPEFAARIAAAVVQTAGFLAGKAPLINLDKIKEAAAAGWQCSGAAAQRELGYRPGVDYPDGFQRQVQFARSRGDL